MNLKVSSEKWRPCCLSLNLLNQISLLCGNPISFQNSNLKGYLQLSLSWYNPLLLWNGISTVVKLVWIVLIWERLLEKGSPKKEYVDNKVHQVSIFIYPKPHYITSLFHSVSWIILSWFGEYILPVCKQVQYIPSFTLYIPCSIVLSLCGLVFALLIEGFNQKANNLCMVLFMLQQLHCDGTVHTSLVKWPGQCCSD